MAQTLGSVTLAAPVADPAISGGGTFTMSATYTQAGHGGEEVVDLHWRFSSVSGSGYTDILTSGALTTPTNPTTGSDSTLTHSTTITGITAGTYYVNVQAVGQTSAASFNNGNQIVTVSAGATTFNQTVTGSLSPSGAISTISTFNALLTGAITTSSNLTKSITQSFGGLITPSATIQKQTNIDKSGSFTTSSTLALKTVILQLVTGQSTLSGIESKRIDIRKGGQISSNGTVLKQIGKGLAGNIAITGANQKRINSIVDGSLTPIGTLATSFVALVSLAGSSILSGIINTLFIPGGAVVEKFNRIIYKPINRIISKLVRKL